MTSEGQQSPGPGKGQRSGTQVIDSRSLAYLYKKAITTIKCILYVPMALVHDLFVYNSSLSLLFPDCIFISETIQYDTYWNLTA